MVQDPLSPPDTISNNIKSLQTQCFQGFFIWGIPQIIQIPSKKMAQTSFAKVRDIFLSQANNKD